MLPGSRNAPRARSVAIPSRPSFPSLWVLSPAAGRNVGALATSAGKTTAMARAGPQRSRCEVSRRRLSCGFARATAASCYRRRLKPRRLGESGRSRRKRIGCRVQSRRNLACARVELLFSPHDRNRDHVRGGQRAGSDAGRLTRLHTEVLGYARPGTFALRERTFAFCSVPGYGRRADSLDRHPEDHGNHDGYAPQPAQHAGISAP